METKERLNQLSETKKLVLRKLLENKDIDHEKFLGLTGSNQKSLRKGAPILFIFPATDGSVSYMRNYLPYIPASWGVYGCQAPGLDGEQTPYRTVAEIASHNVREMRRVQPKGPYYIAGNCMGGLPAYEAARQLEGMGEEVALVLHLMPNFDRPWTKMPGLESLQMRGFVDYTYIIERLLGIKLDLPFEHLAKLDESSRVDFVVNHIREGKWLSEMDLEVFRRRMETYKASLEAMLAYKPERGLRAKLTILAVGEGARGEGQLQRESPYAAALRVIADENIDIAYVDADGGALFDGSEPHMSQIGAELLRLLCGGLGNQPP
jgi:hypothetical protein